MRGKLATIFAGLAIFTFGFGLIVEHDIKSALGLGLFWFVAFALVRPRY